MKLFLLCTFFVISDAQFYNDHYCGNDISNIWLDVIVIIDNSANMTQSNIAKISTAVSDLFSFGTRIGSSSVDPKTTRVGIVTYTSTSKVVATLDTLQSYSSLHQYLSAISAVDTQDAHVATGLQSAEFLLTVGRSNNYRKNYKQVVLLFAKKYEGPDPLPVAQRIKDKGVYIIPIVMDAYIYYQNGNPFEKISSHPEGWTYEYNVDLRKSLMTLLTNVNCYCKPGYVNMGTDNLGKSGVCLKVVTTAGSWSSAKLACQTADKNGYLVSEYSRKKHDFVQELVKNTTGLTSNYHIGLTYDSTKNNFYWEQPAGKAKIGLGATNLIWTGWNPGFPTNQAVNTGVANMIGSNGVVGWQNVNPNSDSKMYVCEAYACDTNFYCA